MVQVAVRTKDAFLGESGQPPTTGGMEVRHNESVLGRRVRKRWTSSGSWRQASRRTSRNSSQELTSADGNVRRFLEHSAPPMADPDRVPAAEPLTHSTPRR